MVIHNNFKLPWGEHEPSSKTIVLGKKIPHVCVQETHTEEEVEQAINKEKFKIQQ